MVACAAVVTDDAIRIAVGGVADRPVVERWPRLRRRRPARRTERFELEAGRAGRRACQRDISPASGPATRMARDTRRRSEQDIERKSSCAQRRSTHAHHADAQRRANAAAHCEPRELLSDFIRHELGATGTHVGCEHGVCGACTVHIDGVAARSCLMLAVQVDGRRIDTVEGLAPDADARRSAAGVPASSRVAVRLLHGGHSDVVRGLSATRARSERSTGARDAVGPSVPLYGLYADRRGGARRGGAAQAQCA